jgi:hypothetical protein
MPVSMLRSSSLVRLQSEDRETPALSLQHAEIFNCTFGNVSV